jgi:hypothetical protein
MKAPNRKERIDDLLQHVANEVYAFVHESGQTSNEGWVSSVVIQKQLGLKQYCAPIGSSNDTPKSWLFNIVMRRLQEQNKVEYRRAGSRVSYRSSHFH